jgi:hypothetical protein
LKEAKEMEEKRKKLLAEVRYRREETTFLYLGFLANYVLDGGDG